jgi:hypothetical protein
LIAPPPPSEAEIDHRTQRERHGNVAAEEIEARPAQLRAIARRLP